MKWVEVESVKVLEDQWEQQKKLVQQDIEADRVRDCQ